MSIASKLQLVNAYRDFRSTKVQSNLTYNELRTIASGKGTMVANNSTIATNQSNLIANQKLKNSLVAAYNALEQIYVQLKDADVLTDGNGAEEAALAIAALATAYSTTSISAKNIKGADGGTFSTTATYGATFAAFNTDLAAGACKDAAGVDAAITSVIANLPTIKKDIDAIEFANKVIITAIEGEEDYNQNTQDQIDAITATDLTSIKAAELQYKSTQALLINAKIAAAKGNNEERQYLLGFIQSA